MPVFHTKTIEGILEPVAQQVGRLVILHEEAEDGNAMPDLERPVLAVSHAVANLVKVGKETVYSSDDAILKQDMPQALHRVEEASKLLEDASRMLKSDPYSGPARKKLIEGARGILQGTSSLLLVFDESEVRKIIRECKKVLEYLAIAEVVETMEDLVQFVKDMSPGLTNVSKMVDAREKELTHQVHREILCRCLDNVKNLTPVLISSMKIFIQIYSQGSEGAKESQENRNYLVQRMTDEINEIIRVLQLTTYDEDEWAADDLTVMKKCQQAIESKLVPAHEWLLDPNAIRGGIGEKAIRSILESALKVADRSSPEDADQIRKTVGTINTMTDTLADLRAQGKGSSPQAQALAKNIDSSLLKLNQLVQQAISNSEKSEIQHPAHTVAGRVEQAQRWLRNPQYDDGGLGYQATRMVVEEGRKVAQGLSGPQRAELMRCCDEVEQLAHQLNDLIRRGQGNSPQAQAIARQLGAKLNELKDRIQGALVQQVVADFADITTPLKQFVDAALAPENKPNREPEFDDKAHKLGNYATHASRTARMVAAAGGCRNKNTVEALNQAAQQVSDLTPQLINAGRIRLMYPTNKSADEHFDMLRKQYADSLTQMRNLVDIAIDTPAFIKATEDSILKHTAACEDAIKYNQPPTFVENTSSIARLANRVLMVAKQESDNSEDPSFKESVDGASDDLNKSIHGMVQSATGLAPNLQNAVQGTQWRQANKGLITSVGNVRHAIMVYPEESHNLGQDFADLNLSAPSSQSQPQLTDQELDNLLNVDFNAMFSQPDLDKSKQQGRAQKGRLDRAPPAPPPPPPSTDHYKLKQEAPVLASHAQGQHASPGSRLYRQGFEEQPVAHEQYQHYAKGHGLHSQNYPPYQGYSYEEAAPPRPPPPGGMPPPRPPPPETDDEDEMSHFPAPQANQPIMMAAHSLHQEARQWSSRDNEIIAAAKRMAILMARLSQLVRGEGGTKKDLIACAKAIADASEEVTRLAKELARQCTDKRMRTALLQVCERIPTIGTQLKILSTVKATMLGAQELMPSPDGSEMVSDGSEEDQEATEMLVGNAQNLMQSVKETVRVAEAASIKIRTDSGYRLRWTRKRPWYH